MKPAITADPAWTVFKTRLAHLGVVARAAINMLPDTSLQPSLASSLRSLPAASELKLQAAA